ncbi:MAG: beta-class carbonic anhydrase [Sciscionella sp.]
MSVIDDVLRRKEESGDRTPDELAAAPSLRLAVVTCMDARIAMVEALGVRRGETHVLRNAGGTVTDDMIRSLSISQHKLGTREVVIMQHTSCGMTSVTDEEFKDELERCSGLRPTWAVEAFRDVETSVRQSVERVRHSSFLLHTDNVRGFVYDVLTSKVTEVA